MSDPHETCLAIENYLPLWAGGDLEPDAQASVEDHLGHCERCSRAAVRARAARVALQRGLRTGSERMGAGRDPWPTIRESLRTEGLVGPARAAPRARPAFRRWSPAWPVAAAVLVGLFLAGTWLPSGPGPATFPSDPHSGDGGKRIVSGPSLSPVDDAAVPNQDGATVAIPASLRRLSPGEPRMRDTAWRFRPAPSPDVIESGYAAPPATTGTPVSFERVQLLRPNPPK